MTLSLALANSLAKLPIRYIQREYPNGLGHLLFGPEDIRAPHELHPAFYGCWDWHSSVHGHWMLVRLLRAFDLEDTAEIRARLNDNLTADNLGRELEYFEKRPSFERTYGWAWFLKLCEACHGWDDEDAVRWASALRPLEKFIVRRFHEFLPKQTYPIRAGTHANTAFGLTFALEYARTVGDAGLGQGLCDAARRYYLNDKNAPVHYEPSGNDFLSPSLIEADLMRRVLEPGDFHTWLDAFLPDFGPLLEPAIVSDRADAQISHLDGLNLSRAWCLNGISGALGAEDPRLALLTQGAERHAEVGLANVASGHYEGEHWLASFAVYMLDSDGWESRLG